MDTTACSSTFALRLSFTDLFREDYECPQEISQTAATRAEKLDNFFSTKKISKQSYRYFSHIIEFIYEKYAQTDSVYLKTNPWLPCSVWVFPKKKWCVFNGKKIAKGQEKSCKMAWMLDDSMQKIICIAKLVNIGKKSISQKEIEISKKYSGMQGFPKYITDIAYQKKINGELCDKTAIFCEKFSMDLFDFIVQARRGKVQDNEVLFVMKNVSSAVCMLHKDKLVHGDIKLENILVELQQGSNKNGELQALLSAVLADYGHLESVDKLVDKKAYIYGSYMSFAPEVWRQFVQSSSQKIDVFKCDVYALGVALAFLMGCFDKKMENKIDFIADSLQNNTIDTLFTHVVKLIHWQMKIKPVFKEIVEKVKNKEGSLRECLIELSACMRHGDPSERPTIQQVKDLLEMM